MLVSHAFWEWQLLGGCTSTCHPVRQRAHACPVSSEPENMGVWTKEQGKFQTKRFQLALTLIIAYIVFLVSVFFFAELHKFYFGSLSISIKKN